MSHLGQHVLADFHGCCAARLSDATLIEQALREAAHAAGAHVLAGHFHHFGVGQGVTGVLLLMESHLSIHSWPEHGYAAIDLFMCGNAAQDAALAVLKTSLQPRQLTCSHHQRGPELPQSFAKLSLNSPI